MGKVKSIRQAKIIDRLLSVILEKMPEFDYTNKQTCEEYYLHTISVLQNADRLFESEKTYILYFRVASYQEDIENYLL